MKLHFEVTDSYPSPSQGDFDRLESLIGHPLPNDFKSFLLEHNGGGCPDTLEYPVLGQSEHYQLGFTCFLPLLSNGKGLLEAGEFMIDNEAGFHHLLCFAEVPDACLCLSFKADEYGSIIWWASDDEDHEDPNELIFVNRSFSDWLNSIVPKPKFVSNSQQPFLAAELGDLNTLVSWIEAGGNPNIVNQDGNNLLLLGIRRPTIVRYLLSVGCNPNCANERGNTPVLRAAWGNLDSLKLLLEYGGNPWLTNDKGETAFDKGRGFPRIRLFLEEFAQNHSN